MKSNLLSPNHSIPDAQANTPQGAPQTTGQELIWILDGDKACVTLYQQTLGLQYRLRILDSLEELLAAMPEVAMGQAREQSLHQGQGANGEDRKPNRGSWLLIADPETSKGSLSEFFRRTSASGGPAILPECMIVSRVDDLNLMRFYLKAGARDYLLKPIRPNELVAKVEKALHHINNREILILRNDLDGLEVSDLTFREHQLLTIFLSRKNRSVRREELYGAIWSKVNVNPKTLDVHLFNLRRKLRPLGYDILCHSQIFSLCKQGREMELKP